MTAAQQEALTTTQPTQLTVVDSWQSIEALKARIQQIQRLMNDVLKKDVDYGIIPNMPKGTKPCLLKPGSEQILAMFRLAVEPIVEDLSTEDCFRYRITVRLTDARTGAFLGAGVGEASTDETKYKWKRTYSQKEYEAMPADRRRSKWISYRDDHGQPQDVEQFMIRQEPADLANTVLKMAKKRCLGSNMPALVKTDLGISRVRIDTMFQMYRKGTDMWLPGPESNWVKVLGMIREERDQSVRLDIRDGSHIQTSAEHRFPCSAGLLEVSHLTAAHSLSRTRIDLGPDSGADVNLGWLVGLFIAEGHRPSQRSAGVSFTLNLDEQDTLVPRLDSIAQKLGAQIYVKRRGSTGTLDVDISGSAIRGILDQFVVGETSYKKHLSKYAWRQGTNFIRAVLDGYLSGDGHRVVRQGHRQRKWILGFTRDNFALAEDLRTISAVLGWRMRLRNGWSECAGKMFPTFTGWISADLPAYNGCDLNSVSGIQVENRKAVLYDIEVEDPHLFVLPNGIISHNSQIDATLTVTGASSMFEQDSFDEDDVAREEAPVQAQRRGRPAKAQAKQEDVKCGSCGAVNGHLPSCKYHASQKETKPAVAETKAAKTETKPVEGEVVADRLVCQIKAFQDAKTQTGTAYVKYEVIDPTNRETVIYCFHKTANEELKAKAVGTVCLLRYSIQRRAENEYIVVEEILEIAGVQYKDGKPIETGKKKQEEPW